MYLETESLSKQYRSVRALDECTLTVEQGEIFGLLGPNGAGKTTLLRLLMGFLKPTSGRARIGGLDCYRQTLQVRQQVSYLPGDVRLFRQMRGRDVLRFLAEVRRGGDFRRALSIAERLELELSRRVAYMSTGMRQKLALVATLSSHTPLLILDEPTSNLDPTVRSTVIDLVREARADGRTIIFSSHVLSEVEEACDRVVILREGKLVHTQIMSELRHKHRISARLNGPLPEVPLELNGRIAIWARNDEDVLIETPGALAPLLGWLSTLPLAEVRIEPVGLRDVYDRYHRFSRDMAHAESRLTETTTR